MCFRMNTARSTYSQFHTQYCYWSRMNYSSSPPLKKIYSKQERASKLLVCDLLKISENTLKVASCIGRYRIEENRHVFREITSRTAIATDNWWDHWLQIGCVWRRSRENSNKDDFTERWSCLTEEQAKRGLWNGTKQQEQDLKRRAESQICSNGASYQLIHWRAHQEVWCCCHQQLYLPLCQHQMVPSLQQELQEIQFRVKIDKKVGHLYSKNTVLKSQTQQYKQFL